MTLEIPAGKLDPGESALDCAARELREETGFVGGELIKVGAVVTTPGFTNEVIHLYVCGPVAGDRPARYGEFINCLRLPVAEVFQHIADGRSKTEDGNGLFGGPVKRAS